MKKYAVFFASLAAGVCLAATTAFAEGTATVTAQSGLNMRQGPGTNYAVVTVLDSGAQVNVVTPDDGCGWAYVTKGQYAGWVYTKYLSGSAATDVPPSWQGTPVACTTSGDANLRRGPGTDSAVLDVVPAGFTVTVDRYANGWASVTWGNTSGYIATSLLNGLPAANGKGSGSGTSSGTGASRYSGPDVVCTIASDANLRSGPSTDYGVLTAVPAGFSVTVHSYSGGWASVSWGDVNGYIATSLISGLPAANASGSSAPLTGTSVYQGYDYANVYDFNYYYSQNGDLRAVFGNNTDAYIQHFVTYGMAEGRQGRASFNVYDYRAANPDLEARFGDDLRCYYLWVCGIPF